MTIRATAHHAHDPEPPVGTELQGGSPTGDRVTFWRLPGGWAYAYGGDTMRPCSYALVQFWCALRVTAGPLLTPRPSVPEEWQYDLEEPA
jgi:hypothetical protein